MSHTSRSHARPIVVSVVIAAGWLVFAAAPASAHTVSGQGSTDFQTRVDAITPATPGLSVKPVELGSRLQLTWTGPDQLIVLGYEGEPYLRVGPDGVFRNSRSPATYLNTTRYGGVTVPPDADPNAPPNWVKIGSGRTVLWHDHRTHWMGGTLPISVRRSPSSFHTVFPWKIDLTEAGRPIEITGSLNWVPGSSSGPWLAGLVLLAAVGIVAGTTRRWAPAMLAFTALIVVADVLHAVGTGLAFAGSVGYRLLILGGSYYSVVAWALGVVAVRLLSRKSIDGLFAAVFTGLVIGLFGGLADVGSLWRSQVPFAWGTTFARVIVMVSIGGSVGLVVGAIVAFRRNRAKPGAEAEVEQAITPA